MIHITVLRRLSWPSLAYMYTKDPSAVDHPYNNKRYQFTSFIVKGLVMLK